MAPIQINTAYQRIDNGPILINVCGLGKNDISTKLLSLYPEQQGNHRPCVQNFLPNHSQRLSA